MWSTRGQQKSEGRGQMAAGRVLLSACSLLLLSLAGVMLAGSPVGASAPQWKSPPPQAAQVSKAQVVRQLDDGFDRLAPGQQGLSYSTLVHMGRVRPPAANPAPSGPNPDWRNPLVPLLTMNWGPDANTSSVSAGEPAVGMHPANFLYALVSGNVTIDNTSDGGNTWAHRNPPNASGYGDVVNAWLEPAGSNALQVALNPSADGADYTCGRSADFGVTWVADTPCGTSASTNMFDDREYLWVDRSPTSPFYGRVYLTGAMFDSGSTGSFNTVTLRRSSDNGATWQPPSNAPLALVPSNEFSISAAHNEFPSLGISSDGTVGYAWHRGLCCGAVPTVGTNNRVMFARSTDGGASFPFSTTIVTVPQNQSVPFNSTSPGGTRWSDAPNIAADPVNNGVFYAVWVQYRTASTPASAAIYLSKTTDNGVSWSTPVIPFNNPNGSIFQGFSWVKVTADGTVHVTYLGGTTTNTAVAQFYVQSTDGGASWTAPFQLSST
ncbi:MAG: sialidase family protein, partial [Chloroflexia bacterium]